MPSFTVNGEPKTLDVEPEMPLLWALRDELGLTGTKFGCGVAACGACTVEIDGVATRSCVLPLAAVEGRSVRTIEGAPDAVVAALQKAWVQHQTPHCGYCQSGMILAAATLLRANPDPSDAEIDAGLTNLRRCGTYQRVRAAVHSAAAGLKGAQS